MATAKEIRKARLRALVLPAAERRQIERSLGVRPPARLSAVLGAFEFLLGVAVYYGAHPGIGGGFGLILWHLNPLAWLGVLFMLTALGRVGSFVANNDSFGEPLVWVYLRLLELRRGAGDRRRALKERGPRRADRIVVEPDGGLALLADRARPDWDDTAAVRVGDEFFSINRVEERRDGPYTAVAYILEPHPESENLLGIVHTDATLPASPPPQSDGDADVDEVSRGEER